MASIRKRGEFQWEVQIRKKGFPAQTKTFNTKAEAEAWAAIIESEMVRGVFVSRAEAERTTLGQIIDRYIREVTPSHRGQKPEELRLKALMRHPLASRFVATLVSSDFAKYRDERLKGDSANRQRPAKPATVHRELGLFQQVIDQARREWGITLAENPLSLVSRPKIRDARQRRLDPLEEKYLLLALTSGGRDADGQFIEGTRNPWIVAAVRLALQTAMRQGELVQLEWANVDLQARVAFLPLTKNGSARAVPLSREAVAILEALPKPNNENDEAEEDEEKDDRVLPITANALKLAWQRALTKARGDYLNDCQKRGAKPDPYFLLNLRFHDLRHEATSRLADKLPNILDLASVTGHKDLQMLKRYYHPKAEELAKKLD